MADRVRVLLIVVAASLSMPAHAARPEDGAWLNAYREAAGRIIGEAMSSQFAWQRLALLGDTFGNRLSGSRSLEEAIQWAAAEMKKDGLENVHTEPVKVPHWVRGIESAEITSPRQRSLVMLGLGNSIGTPPDGIEADVLVVRSFEELESNTARVKGRIVLYNVPFTSYGETVQFRSNGPSRAAALGAVAVLVRSVGPPGLRLPHTGALRYADRVAQIPAAAITTEDADLLERLQERGTTPRVRLRMDAKFLPDADSFNVVGELRGRERPDEAVVVGGHIDSWDVGTGSTDDGGGCVVTWEALRIMKKLNLRPRRTVRVVLWTNEENGTRGAIAYRDRYRAQLANHVLMLESDDGVLHPSGFGFTGTDAARTRIKEIASLLRGIQLDRIGSPGEGADIGPSVQAANIPSMSLTGDGNYFLLHHTPADTIDKIDPMDMSRASAAVAVIAYVVAEMEERLK
jgi:carboxypeptidase Q